MLMYSLHSKNKKMTFPNEQSPLDESVSKQESMIPSYEQLAGLSDEAYLSASHEFGVQYHELLTHGGAVGELADRARTTLEPYLRKLEGQSDREVAATLLRGYRSGYNQILQAHGATEKYTDINPSNEDLAKVKSVAYSPLGTPILEIPDSDSVFQKRTATGFSASFLTETVELPPFVVVNTLTGETAKKIATHETSHSAWKVLELAGIIPPIDEGTRPIGERSPLDVARDEAVAQQVAHQGAIGHHNVVSYAKTDGLPAEVIERYQECTRSYAAAMRNVQGIDQSDAVLGFMAARTWEDFFTHVERMTRLAEAAPHESPLAHIPLPVEGIPSGWGTAT
jgi:hypothetical protein